MAPSKASNAQNTQSKQSSNIVAARKGITTRSQNSVLNNVLMKSNVLGKDAGSKRKAEASPQKEKTTKRSALGNITNVCRLSVSSCSETFIMTQTSCK